MKKPKILKNILSEQDYQALLLYVKNPKRFEYASGFGRYYASDDQLLILKKMLNDLTIDARKAFNSKTLLPTYALFAHYEGEEASLYKHKDDNACTYTLDMCVYQNEPWDLWVDNRNYTLQPNQALAYYGNDQLHWREKFPNPETNYVAMIFFHFAEPDHWYFTKGPEYLRVVRGEITEEQWEKSKK